MFFCTKIQQRRHISFWALIRFLCSYKCKKRFLNHIGFNDDNEIYDPKISKHHHGLRM